MRGLAGDFGGVLGEGFAAAGGADDGIDHAFLKLFPHGGHIAEFLDDLGKSFDDVVDVLGGVVVAEAHDDVALGERVIELDGAEDVGNLERLADAAGTAGDGDALVIEEQELAFALDELGGEIEGVADAERAGDGAVELDEIDVLPEAVVEALLQRGDVGDIFFHIADGDLRGDTGADNGGDVLGASAAAAFLHTTVNMAGDAGLAAAVEDADALRAVETVRAEAEELDAEVADVDGHPASGGEGVAVKGDAFFGGDLRDFLDRLDGADVVVDEMDGDEGGLGREGGADVLGVDATDLIDGDLGDFEAVLGQVLDGVHDRGVLDGGDDDVVALGADVGVGEALDGEVGRLGAAGGEDEILFALRVDHGGDLPARFA